MVKLGKLLPLVIILFMGLFLTTIVIGSNVSQRLANPPSKTPTSTEITKLQVCPDKWYKNEQPCTYQNSPTECKQQQKEYFIISGERKEVEKVDTEWVRENCEVNKPEAVH